MGLTTYLVQVDSCIGLTKCVPRTPLNRADDIGLELGVDDIRSPSLDDGCNMGDSVEVQHHEGVNLANVSTSSFNRKADTRIETRFIGCKHFGLALGLVLGSCGGAAAQDPRIKGV
ncbi:hypothetical protein GOBAR_AA27522 [Gossypium barbadense]|uniref:Uncharacterized protein n=1 Tax=Gossypium barbadense TaxID=3634 RepID=A0A2P5WQ24_GOSBA|nr:hypothetical protein GOBAR_AA27522 [Gossypium barbadense]